MLFTLRVVREGVAPHELKLEAASLHEARAQAERQGLSVLRVKVASQYFAMQKSQFPLMLFCQEFRVLLEAGLSMVEVLDTLTQKETNAIHQSRLATLSNSIKEGQPLSHADIKYEFLPQSGLPKNAAAPADENSGMLQNINAAPPLAE